MIKHKIINLFASIALIKIINSLIPIRLFCYGSITVTIFVKFFEIALK